MDGEQQAVTRETVCEARDERRQEPGGQRACQAGQADLDNPSSLVGVDEQRDHERALGRDTEHPRGFGQPDLAVPEGLAQRALRRHRRMIRGLRTPSPRLIRGDSASGYTRAHDGTEHGRLLCLW